MKNSKNFEVFSVFTLAFVLVVLVFTFGVLGSSVGAHLKLVDLPPPSPTSISCSVSSTSLPLGNSTTISGSISPAIANATVKLTYTKPDATTVVRTVITADDGSYSDTCTPDTSGSWSVKASWDGNDSYLGSNSFDVPFTVTSSSSGFPIILLYVAVAIVVIVVIAGLAIISRKKK